jgi:formylglycine-generating enzyme required for sulfatase activity
MASQRPPDAFLSYTRFDDRRRFISAFREHLEDAVREVTGQLFEIFQDVDGIGIGEHWPDKLDQMLDEARFFIPIVTPSYFTSKPCREELEKFLRAEAARGRNDLVLPIYYIECDVLADPKLRAADPLAAHIYKRQYHDWLKLRFSSFNTKIVKTALHQLASEIARARRRTMPEVTAPQTRAKAHGSASQSEQTAAVPPPPAVAMPRRAVAATSSAALLAHAPLTWERSTDTLRSTHVNLQDTLALPDCGVTSRPEPLRRGTVFRDIDAPWCPEMVVIPPGEFVMGSTEAEKERPQHRVRIVYRLAVGRYPVTFDEYDHFARSTGRVPPSDEGWGRCRRPVINVSWDDARAYVEWLAAATGQSYRLLSEAEWEHACRAGTATRYSWGDHITPENANYGKNLRKTSEVGSYAANPLGLYDMQGNVWEWVEDRWHDNYDGAPHDGSAWTEGSDPCRVARGGSWGNSRMVLRSTVRVRYDTDARRPAVGFRVARTL